MCSSVDVQSCCIIMYFSNSHIIMTASTHVKISQFVDRTSLLTSCNKLVISYQLVTNLLASSLLQPVGLQTCGKLFEQFVTSLLSSTTLQQLVNKLGTRSANTSCSQLVCCRFVTTPAIRVNTSGDDIYLCQCECQNQLVC